ncbi:cbb3-type cytochrome oxidase subunit 3 [Massilia sp. LXY-6]|uniref:cbb3-type cytochrome oxidase subunit 3 n=1 Tax=Massilia sp. LXY-6 TaxID=3379823 RepID=UPI003EDF762F
MALQHIFDDASRIMTVISFATFAGILAWTYVLRKEKDFAQAAGLPFADDADADADAPGEDYV